MLQWLRRPVEREDVIRRLEHLGLRFSLMDEALDLPSRLEFLASLREVLSGYIAELRRQLGAFPEGVGLHARLSLELGIDAYRTHKRWAQRAAKRLESAARPSVRKTAWKSP